MRINFLPLFSLGLCALLALSFAAPTARAQGGKPQSESIAVRGILFVASNQPGETDRRLAPYEPTLRGIFRFESYRFIAEGRATVAAPGQGSVSLSRGHRLELEREASDGKAVRVKVRWLENDNALMTTTLQLKRGLPAVLGGKPWGDKGEVCSVIILAD